MNIIEFKNTKGYKYQFIVNDTFTFFGFNSKDVIKQSKSMGINEIRSVIQLSKYPTFL